MRATVACLAVALAGCAGSTPEVATGCPNVEAVAGLDRLALTYPGAERRVNTRLDVLDTACLVDDEDVVVGTVLAIRVGAGRPPGELRVPYTVILDRPDGPGDARGEVAVVPAGAMGTTSYFEHRFLGLAGQDDVFVRLLYALVPDAEARERMASELTRD